MKPSKCSIIGSLLFAVAINGAGCAAPAPDEQSDVCNEVLAVAANDEADAMPNEIRAYLAEHGWSHMHLDFHVARMWDMLGEDTQAWAMEQGIERWKLQEGEPTTGVEFLAMHRLMITELREKFPEHAELFAGWEKPPTGLDEPSLPAGTGTFRSEMVTAIDRLHDRLGEFASDDDFALFLQTNRRPTSTGRSPDRSAGLHNYLHNRWQDPQSPINVGDPSLNLGNKVFWKIHGWVDARWTAYRAAKGLDDATDEVYRKAMDDAQVWMDDVMERSEHAGHKLDDGCQTVPDEVRTIFSE